MVIVLKVWKVHRVHLKTGAAPNVVLGQVVINVLDVDMRDKEYIRNMKQNFKTNLNDQ